MKGTEWLIAGGNKTRRTRKTGKINMRASLKITFGHRRAAGGRWKQLFLASKELSRLKEPLPVPSHGSGRQAALEKITEKIEISLEYLDIIGIRFAKNLSWQLAIAFYHPESFFWTNEFLPHRGTRDMSSPAFILWKGKNFSKVKYHMPIVPGEWAVLLSGRKLFDAALYFIYLRIACEFNLHFPQNQ